jgi:predicted nucleic acid-binding protein
MIVFLDTNAVAKRYVPEPGSAWIQGLCDPSRGHYLFIAQITLVEFSSVIYKKTTSGVPLPRLKTAHADKITALFKRQIRRKAYHEVRLTRAILQRATQLIRSHPGLRSLDAIQLASALIVRDNALARGISLPLFVTADMKLLRIAAAEGLPTENPEIH